MSDEQSEPEADRHEIDCRCGHTAVGETVPQAEETHLLHFLNDHDDVADWERDAANDQLDYAREQRAQEEGQA